MCLPLACIFLNHWVTYIKEDAYSFPFDTRNHKLCSVSSAQGTKSRHISTNWACPSWAAKKCSRLLWPFAVVFVASFETWHYTPDRGKGERRKKRRNFAVSLTSLLCSFINIAVLNALPFHRKAAKKWEQSSLTRLPSRQPINKSCFPQNNSRWERRAKRPKCKKIACQCKLYVYLA